MASPELYIIVNGRPTKSKVVWRTLVDVNHIKAAVSVFVLINDMAVAAIVDMLHHKGTNISHVLNNLKSSGTVLILGTSHHAKERAKHAISIRLYFFNSSHIWAGEWQVSSARTNFIA